MTARESARRPPGRLRNALARVLALVVASVAVLSIGSSVEPWLREPYAEWTRYSYWREQARQPVDLSGLQVVDLSTPGMLARLEAQRPEHFEKVQQLATWIGISSGRATASPMPEGIEHLRTHYLHERDRQAAWCGVHEWTVRPPLVATFSIDQHTYRMAVDRRSDPGKVILDRAVPAIHTSAKAKAPI